MDLDDLKKYFYILVAMLGLGWYVSNHYTFRDVLKYSREHPDPKRSPALDYYTGMGFFLKEDYDGAIEAFTQLLADYPTCHYAPTAMVKLGSAYTERYRFANAREVYEKFFEEHPTHKERPAVEKRYEYIKFK
ncbi:MAG: outer membrane protein assembly factor BamD [Elusimicrobia bacterium]|nr:outer membrane protein assembly factor BamD [Elusimicrobiota bacterium]